MSSASTSSQQSSTRLHVAVAVAVGPGVVEVDRLRDLADSITYYDAGPTTLVLVDDSPTPRGLDALLGNRQGLSIVSLHHPRHGSTVTFTKGKGICSAILLALQWISRNLDAAFVLKLDTDSLVIAPFRERLQTTFDQTTSLGMVGAHTLTPNGSTRDWSHHAKTVSELAGEFDWRRPLQSLRTRRDPIRRHISELVRRARAHGYIDGEHCMGGGYALSGELIRRLASANYLDDPALWMNVDLPEDVMVGLHTRAVGMTLANSVGEGGVFGVRYVGLPYAPADLLAKGYAVIHAVKNDKEHDESSIRAFFKSQRNQA